MQPTSGLAIWWLTKVQINNLQIQSVVRAGQATLNFSCYLQQNNFNQQRLWADTATIHHIAKP
jgi:hypothetical protein